MNLLVEEIHFNHDPNSANSDGLNIRVNGAGAPIVAPEWKHGHNPLPAAYACSEISGPVTINVIFRGGNPNTKIRIRALDASIPTSWPQRCIWKILNWVARLFTIAMGGILGSVAAKAVLLDGSGQSASEIFHLHDHRLRAPQVGIHIVHWTWQYRSKFWFWHRWITFAHTIHRVYSILRIPSGPWSQDASFNNALLPWVDALDKACVWAAGANDPDAAAAAVTRAVNTRFNQSYTPATMFGWNNYQLSSYLADLDSGQPFMLNCTDCADAVTTFSNLLGCNLWEGRFLNMQTRKFLTLNGNPANGTDWVSWSWGYHEICWHTQIDQNGHIYDGCLQIDMDNNYMDNVHVARHPIKMRFGLSAPNDYRFRLIESGPGTLENIPRRRSLV